MDYTLHALNWISVQNKHEGERRSPAVAAEGEDSALKRCIIRIREPKSRYGPRREEAE